MLSDFATLLAKWNTAINLVAPQTICEIWSRHILDSQQLDRLAPKRVDHWVDLGSGGGLPGIVLAIVRRTDPTRFTLIESDRRKATFLRTAIREAGLNADVICDRIEYVDPLDADVISARALARLTRLLEFQQRHARPGAIGLYPKGATAKAEIPEALERWSFTCDKVRSTTSVDSLVLKIGDLTRA